MLLLKASLLLSAMLLAAHLLRRAPAASRHRLWTLAFAAMLALPLLGFALPVFYVPVPASLMIAPAISLALPATLRSTGDATIATIDNGEKRAASVSAVPRETSGQQQSAESRQPMPSGTATPSLRAILMTVWLAGTLAAAAALLLSLVRVRRLARAAGDIADPEWSASADALGARLGLRRPARLLVSVAVGTPMAGGIWRPVIFLPSSAPTWGAERRDVVLAHEIAHLAGRDPLRHLAARLAVALYWFHPLAWVAARQAAVAREQACDEAVLALGTRPSAYARVLLELAESMQPSAVGIGALPMVERSHLETRLMAILKNDGVAARTNVWIPAIGVALGTLAIAAAQPGVRASAAQVAPPAAAQPAPASLVAVAPKPGQLPAIWLNATEIRLHAAPSQAGADSACERVMLSGRAFYGTTSTRGDGRVYDMIGSSDSDRVIAKSLGDVRVCMLAERAGPRVKDERPSQWPGRAPRVVMEARRGGDFQRLEITSESGAQRISWQVGGTPRPFDAAAQQWRDRMLAALDTMWEISTLRGEVSSLRGEISSIHGEESSRRGEISSFQGEISSMRGRQSSIRGEESSLRGRISSMRGHVSSLRGAISSEQGSISGLNALRYGSADSSPTRDLIAEHEKAIVRLETEIRAYNVDAKVAAVEKEILALDADGQVEAIEREIRAFDLNGKVAAIERRIADLQVDGKIAAIERQIAALDADRRGRQLEERRDEELKRLEAAIAAIR